MYLTASEIATKYGLSASTVRRYAHAGLIKHFQIGKGKMMLFDAKSVDVHFKATKYQISPNQRKDDKHG